MNQNLKRVRHRTMQLCEFDELTIEEAVAKLQELAEGVPENAQNAVLDYDYDGEITLIYQRPMNDAELANAKLAEGQLRQRELQELARLKAKYPDA